MRRGGSLRRLRKLLRALIRHGELNHGRLVAHAVGLIAGLGVRDVRSVQHCVSGGILKAQRSGPSQLLQHRVGVGNTGDLNVDPVRSLLIYLRLGGIALHTLLQLVNGIIHVRAVGFLVTHHLIGDAHAARQIKPLLDAGRGTGTVFSHAANGDIAQSGEQDEKHDERDNAFIPVHFFAPICAPRRA